MRPSTAKPSHIDNYTARSIWKKYESIKPEKNQFYCFKTISEILQQQQRRSSSRVPSEKEIFYQKVKQPRNILKENSNPIEATKRKILSIVENNPTLKKPKQNNFLSNKVIEVSEKDKVEITREVKTQKMIPTEKFVPYRQQTLVEIKNDKIQMWPYEEFQKCSTKQSCDPEQEKWNIENPLEEHRLSDYHNVQRGVIAVKKEIKKPSSQTLYPNQHKTKRRVTESSKKQANKDKNCPIHDEFQITDWSGDLLGNKASESELTFSMLLGGQ